MASLSTAAVRRWNDTIKEAIEAMEAKVDTHWLEMKPCSRRGWTGGCQLILAMHFRGCHSLLPRFKLLFDFYLSSSKLREAENWSVFKLHPCWKFKPHNMEAADGLGLGGSTDFGLRGCSEVLLALRTSREWIASLSAGLYLPERIQSWWENLAEEITF